MDGLVDWERLLSRVQRPSRYLGREINIVRKEEATTHVALVFPDLYEVGMSHLGLKILYHILNQRPDIAAERVFAPDLDLEALLRRNGYPLTSLETSRPLNQFDLIGFTLQYELSYTNILNILDLGQVPLRTTERIEGDYPLVMAGGPGAYNPEPLAPFVDLFIIGEGEEVILEVVDLYQQWRSQPKDREELLQRMATLPGIYVPSLRSGDSLPKVVKRYVRDLDQAPFPSSPVVPYSKIVHDRVVIEISRGCTQGCRFCQAGIIYRPLRERSLDTVKRLARESLKNTGYEELSLIALNSGDYSCLTPLISELMQELIPQRISLSLPSLRPGSLNHLLLSEIGKVRKTGFTLVPEAGTERLRRVINKEMDEERIMEDLEHLLGAGWDSLKLYFMIGLPTETDEDIRGIVSLCKRILTRATKRRSRQMRRISISLSPFVPKPHTPFQWSCQEELPIIKEKLRYIRSQLRDRRFQVKWQVPEMSFLEAVIAMGNRRIAEVIERAFHEGCRFDSWTDKLDFDRWMRAFQAAGVDPSTFVHSKRDPAQSFCWDFIDTGVRREFLLAEWERARSGLPTSDCREGPCHHCGMGCQGRLPLPQPPEPSPSTLGPVREPEGRPERVRLKIRKEGPLRYLSHLEFQQLFYRACRRAQLPLCYTQGYRPHPKISFGPALPVGIESEAEFVDLELLPGSKIMTLLERLNVRLPEGISISGWRVLTPKDVSISLSQTTFKYKIDIRWTEGGARPPADRIVSDLLDRERIPIIRERGEKSKQLDIRPYIISLRVLEQDDQHVVLEMVLKHTLQGGVKPTEVLREMYGEEAIDRASIEIRKLSPEYF